MRGSFAANRGSVQRKYSGSTASTASAEEYRRREDACWERHKRTNEENGEPE
jgi:hypothetical protein